MARTTFPITTFTDLSGSPLSLGYITVRLSTDAKSPTSSQVCTQEARIELWM